MKKRVLYIENEAEYENDIGQVAKRNLEELCQFTLVTTIEAAYKFMANNVYDIIFIDLAVDHAEGDDLANLGIDRIETETKSYSGIEIVIKVQEFSNSVQKAHKVIFTGNPNNETYQRFYKRLSEPKEIRTKDVDDQRNIEFMKKSILSIKKISI